MVNTSEDTLNLTVGIAVCLALQEVEEGRSVVAFADDCSFAKGERVVAVHLVAPWRDTGCVSRSSFQLHRDSQGYALSDRESLGDSLGYTLSDRESLGESLGYALLDGDSLGDSLGTTEGGTDEDGIVYLFVGADEGAADGESLGESLGCALILGTHYEHHWDMYSYLESR